MRIKNTVSLINDHLGPLLVGGNSLATEKLYDMMMRMAFPTRNSYFKEAIPAAFWHDQKTANLINHEAPRL